MRKDDQMEFAIPSRSLYGLTYLMIAPMFFAFAMNAHAGNDNLILRKARQIMHASSDEQTTQTSKLKPIVVSIELDDAASGNRVALHAYKVLLDELAPCVKTANCQVRPSSKHKSAGNVRLSIDPRALGKEPVRAESFRIVAKGDSVEITGSDGEGVLWGVWDFLHYYAESWMAALAADKPFVMDFSSSPTIDYRGLWTWWWACYDPYAYIDRASEWKYNTISFWNRGVPSDAEHLNAYAHDRGVKIWWGFSWGWIAPDFADASPALAKRLFAIYEEQKKRIGQDIPALCPNADETPQALMDYVLDVFEHQYAWIPDLDGVYFQTATEALCPCEKCTTTPRGENFMRTMLPIIEELHRRYPNLLISCGIHNTAGMEDFKALKGLPDYCNICWEGQVPWAPTLEIAKDQLTYRGARENFAGVYRITMHCGMIMRGGSLYRNEPDRNWLSRIEKLWDYLDNGDGSDTGTEGFRLIEDEGFPIGYPCTSDWRPKDGGRMIDNPNFQELLTWSRPLAGAPAAKKGVFALVDNGLWELKQRRVPSMVAEAIWDPLMDEKELEHRAGLIWRKEIGGWREPVIPYWKPSAQGAASSKGQIAPDDPGEIFRLMEKEGKK